MEGVVDEDWGAVEEVEEVSVGDGDEATWVAVREDYLLTRGYIAVHHEGDISGLRSQQAERCGCTMTRTEQIHHQLLVGKRHARYLQRCSEFLSYKRLARMSDVEPKLILLTVGQKNSLHCFNTECTVYVQTVIHRYARIALNPCVVNSGPFKAFIYEPLSIRLKLRGNSGHNLARIKLSRHLLFAPTVLDRIFVGTDKYAQARLIAKICPNPVDKH